MINKPPHNSTAMSGVFFSEDFKNNRLIKENAKTNLNDPFYLERLLRRKAHQDVVLKVMADHNLDALVYPMKTLPASRIGGRTAPAPAAAGYRPASGNVLSSQTGFPSIVMPAGFTTHVYEWVPDPADASRTVLGEAMSVQVPVAWNFWGCRSASRLCCGSSRATKASHAIAGRLRNFPLVSSTRQRGKVSGALTRPADRFPVARRNARDDPLEVARFEHSLLRPSTASGYGALNRAASRS